MAHVLHGIGHFDISGPDIDSMSSFYAGLLGWKIEPRGPGYALVATPESSPDGAIVESEEPAIKVGVVVASVEDAVRDAEELGGSVSMPATDNGWVVKAEVADPAGNPLTLIQA